MTFPLKVNVFPSADIINPLLASNSQPDFDMIKHNGFIFAFPSVPVIHQLSIDPEFEYGSQPNQILLHQLSIDLIIRIPSLYVPSTDGFTYINLPNVFIPVIVQSVLTSTNPFPFNANVLPSADIYKLLLQSPAQDVTSIIKPQELLIPIFGEVNIDHYPSISPVLDVLLHPNQIDELPVFVTDLAILKPSSQLVAVGFIYILSFYVNGALIVVNAFEVVGLWLYYLASQ
ncbi:MAG: hypothetical protein EZS28_006947 [Streblomastix strix]|uniref:Uncharacterized protein n=1 Tax=Streblomastix strix TaxID=222440 RepID=A0A5J4WQW5_9EUKA|nr:MAG: hypothetical protein EZS28_006947 [Streblomastix strix]